MNIAADAEEYLHTSFDVISDHVVRNLLLIALHSVDSTEFPSGRCRKAIRCTIVVVGITCVT